MGFTTGFVRHLSPHHDTIPASLLCRPCSNQKFSSQLGGLTLTYSLLYLSLYLHRTNRTQQHTLLSQQSLLLNSLLERPTSSLSSTSRTRRTRIDPETLEVEERWKKDSLTERLKDRWNGEVEGMVRRVAETDWRAVRERWERRGLNLWRNMTTTKD
ncbi:hypothetical protein EPUS_00783 [Endocarpon pusillum Z07020]|uniref:MICOS complex subunit MIC12 n=1 Tax=Endocarpon pusillum (strain Z07020 / HMAS-L-300199) TaxID=1263415 RepID=U1GQQ5_ENDPU|nr:uncharacterized protein EPUS_00783 [Endocarpon pusillum Z07020]ERF74653.1 hypothetical protein EPUS_00783 [Endocarpon pusillum Z07020]